MVLSITMRLQNIAFKKCNRNTTSFYFIIHSMRIFTLNCIIELIGDREKLCIDTNYNAMQWEK